MASGSSYQQRRQLDSLKQPDQDQQQQQQAPDLEGLDQDRELTADMAAQLAPQLGNLALQALLGDQAKGTEGIDGAAQEEEEEQVEEVLEVEDLDQELELEGSQFGGGGGGGADAPADDPWDVGKLFGDDDDEDDGPTPQKPRGQPRRRRTPDAEELDEAFEDEEVDAGALREDDLAGIDDALGPPPERAEGPREGDSRYQAVEAALLDPRQLGRRALEPEDLVGTADAWDPVGRPSEIARFLSTEAASPRARGFARLLVRAGASLVPEAGGYAGGVARMATLAICAEAAEGGGEATDRAVALALETGVWEDAVSTARPMAQQGRLHAPMIHQALTGGEAPPAGARRLPEPSVLGGRALERIVPPAWIPPVPALDVAPRPAAAGADAELAALDAAFDLLLTGAPPPDDGPDAAVPRDALEPALFAARHIMNAVGRAHVELAAAAFAVTLVRPGAPVRPVLTTADKALSELARAVLKGGRDVERLERRTRAEALRALRAWAYASLAGAMDA